MNRIRRECKLKNEIYLNVIPDRPYNLRSENTLYPRASLNELDWLIESVVFRRQVVRENFKLLSLYCVYHIGWEMDNWGAIAEKDGKYFRLETDHGRLVKMEVNGPNVDVELLSVLKLEDF